MAKKRKSSRAGKNPKGKNRSRSTQRQQRNNGLPHNLPNPNITLSEPGGPQTPPERSGDTSTSGFDRLTSMALDFIREQGKQGTMMSFDEAVESEKFRNILEDLKSDDNSSTGPKARALVDLNRRRPEWDWPVGETPDE